MKIGIPKEIKTNENRIALVPAGVEALVADGHTVIVEADAGLGSGFTDAQYRNAGAQVADTAAVWADTNLPKGNAAKAAHPTNTRQANRTGNFISLILSEKTQAGNRNLLRVPPTAEVLIHQLDITGDLPLPNAYVR